MGIFNPEGKGSDSSLASFFGKKNQAKYNDIRKSVLQVLSIVSGKMKKSCSKIAFVFWTFLLINPQGNTQEAPTENPISNQGKVIPVETALRIIKANEKKVKEQAGIVTWTLKGTIGKTSLNDGSFSPKPNDPNLSGDQSVVYQPSTGKFNVSFKGIMPWIAGRDPYLAGETMEAYDGVLFLTYQRTRPGKEFPPETAFGFATFSNDLPKKIFKNKGGAIGSFSINFFDQVFSDFVGERNESKEIISVKEHEGMLFIESLPDLDSFKKETIIKISYSANKGSISKVDFLGASSLKTKWTNKTWRTITVETKNFGGDLNFPVKITDQNLIDGFTSIVEYQGIKVKQTFAEDPFSQILPPGTRIQMR